MFRFTRKPSSGSHSQYLAKITHSVQRIYQCYGCILWPVRRVCFALCEGILYTLTQNTTHTPHRSQYAAITLIKSCTSSTYPLWTACVILAKYWLYNTDEPTRCNNDLLIYKTNSLLTVHIVPRYRSPSPCPPPQQDTICCKNLSLTLLMMGKILPETCWADLIDQ